MSKSLAIKDEGEEKWDDDFLGESKEPLKLKLNRREDQTSEPDSRSQRDQKRPSFHKEFIRHADSTDNIPNIGLDGIDLIDDTRERLNSREKGENKTLSNLHRNGYGVSNNKYEHGERVSSNDNDSHQIPSEVEDVTVEDVDADADDDDLKFFEEMEEEEDYRRNQQYARKEPTFRRQFQAPNILQLSSTIQEKGSLLEFLETNLREKFCSNLLPALSKSGSNAARESGIGDNDDVSSSDWAIFIDEDEVDSRGIINQHLRGLTEWIHSTSTLLNSCISIENSNRSTNARTLMESEVQVFQTDVYFIEQVLERCEQEPTKESCIYSLEVIVKWIRGICHQKIYDDIDESDQYRASVSSESKDFRKSDQRPSSSPASSHHQNSSNLAKFHITLERLEQLFARCDYILNEQSKFTVAQILELISVLRDELNAISSGFTDRKRGTIINRSNVVRDIIHFLCNQISLSRIHVYMLDIKAHINFFDSLASHLEALEVIWDELEAIKSWLTTVTMFLPPPRIDFRSVSTDTQISRDPALTLQSHPKFEEAMRAAIQEEIKLALTSNQTSSLHFHRFNQSHGAVLSKMLIELQACCLANKLLLLSEISSITMQKNSMKPRSVHPNSHTMRLPSGHNFFSSTSAPPASSNITSPPYYQKKANAGIELHSKYNVVYEINIGTQFVDLMLKLESPSIVRAKLAFAAVCYLQCLQRDSLPWQSGKYNRIVLKKRNADGFNILKRGDSELGFGVDGDDIDYYIEDYSTAELERTIIGTFSSALGSIDEMKNLQSLLYEAAFDLFPHYRNFNSYQSGVGGKSSSAKPFQANNTTDSNDFPKKKPPVSPSAYNVSPSSEMLFAHLTTSLDMNLSVHDKIKEKNPSSPPRSPRKASKSSRLNKSSSNDQASTFDHRAIILVNKRIKDFVPSRNKHRQLTHLMKYELFLFSFALLSQFVTAIYDVTPNLALELCDICARIAAHVDKGSEQIGLQRKAFLLAIKLGRCESAIKHGRQIWEIMFNAIKASPDPSTLEFNEEMVNTWEEFFFVTKNLVDQYFINAQYPMAMKVIVQALDLMLSLQRDLLKNNQDQLSINPHKRPSLIFPRVMLKRIDLENAIHALLLQQGKAYLHLNRFDSSLSVLQRTLLVIKGKECTIKQLEWKVIFLSWMMQCFYEMRDYDCANLMIHCIKAVRSQEMKTFLQQYIGLKRTTFRTSEMHRSDNQPPIHQLYSNEPRTQKSRSRESGISASGPLKSNPFLQLEKGYIEEEFLSSNKTCSLQDKKATPRSFPQSRMKPNLSSESLSSEDTNLSQVLESSESMFQPFLGHAMTRRFLVNDSASRLPRYCITDHSFDLGAVQAKIYFKKMLYEKALCSLTPVILSAEVVGGGKGGSIDSMIELAELYLLRGQIQYEACRIFTSQSSTTAAEVMHFPFDVGSSQLLFNIHTLSLQIQDLIGKGRQERKSFQSSASKLLDRIHVSKQQHFSQQNLKGIPPPLSAVAGSLTATNLTSKAKMIPYNNPADLLWDAMKWYRRAFDLFHAAGDQISAAKSANHIAECHLLPTFVPHLFFNLPLNVAIDLSLYQGVEGHLNFHRPNIQPPVSSSSTPSNASHHNDLHNIHFDHPQSSTTGTTRSAVSVSSLNAPTAGKHQHHSPSAALSYGSKPPLPAANKTLAMSGATVVKRFASLEEVEKVSLFALEKFLEAYVCPLELIQSYLNLAEMMLITGNIQDSLHFWWEAKELFLHLFVDGCFIPISRVCSLDYLDKLVSVLDRIVRCLWKWDKNIRNSHLHLLEIHNIVGIERKRRAKRHTMTYQVNQQHVYEFLHHIFDAHMLLQMDGRSYNPKVETTATLQRTPFTDTASTVSSTGHSHGPSLTTGSIPTSLSAAESKPVSLLKKPRGKKRGVFAKLRKSLLSLVGKSDHNVADSRSDGFKSSSFLVSSNRHHSRSHFDYHLIESMIQDMCSDLKDKSDLTFYLEVIRPLISDRIMDFGWSNFIDYHKHMEIPPFNLAKSQSRDSVASSIDPRNRSTDSNIPIGGAMSSTRSSSILRPSNQTATSSRHSSHGKDKEDRFITEAVLNIIRRSSFQCKRMPRYLKPFTLTWGDIINSDSSFSGKEEEEETTFNAKGKEREGLDSFPQSNYLYNSGGEGTRKKSVLDVQMLSRDPLVNLLINEKPVDPLYDFDWMDETYTLTYVPSLLVNRSTSRSTLESNFPEIGSDLPSLSSFNEDSLSTLEVAAERVLVYRVWALLQRNHNFMITPYRRHALTFSTIGKIMRTSLSKISHNMLRLKAFSRQLKGNFLSFDHLLLLLQKNVDFSSPSDPTIPLVHPQSKSSTVDFDANDASSCNKFICLQYRLPKLLYMISVDNLLLAYHPFSSRETIQILNQDCLSFNQSSSFYQGLSGVSSASHSQSNYDLVSHKLSTNATHNASMAAIKATGSSAPIISTTFPQTTYPPHQIQTEGIATADDSFTTTMTDLKTSAIEFSDHQLCFLFDLFTQHYDYQCAGGYQNRHFLLQQMREQDLSGLLDFIRLCSDYDLSVATPRVTELHQHYSSSIPLSQETINPIYKEDFAASTLESFSGDVMKRSSTDRVTRGMSMGIEVAMTMSLDNCVSSDDIPHPHDRSREDRMSTMFTSVTDQATNNSSTSGPVTLICGSFPQLIPWEGILVDLTIVRNIGLMPLVMQMLELEEAYPSGKHSRHSNTQAFLPALSISNDDSITPISSPATSFPNGTLHLLSEERDREQERVSSYNSYASSSSSPSMSSNRHTHLNNASMAEWKIRGCLSPSLNQKALYVAISWDSTFFGPNLNRELEVLTDRRQFQSGHEHLVPLLNASSREVMQSFERHVQHRQTDLLIRSNSTMVKGEERHLLNSNNSSKILERFQSVSSVIRSGLYPVSIDMSEKNAMSILEDHEILLLQLDSIRDVQTYEDFWANINSKLFELNSRNRLFSANQSALKSALRYDNLSKSSLLARYNQQTGTSHRRSRQMTEEEENEFLSKIYLLETNHNFTHAFRGRSDSNRNVAPVTSISDDVTYFPILFVPLSELIDLSEALLFLYCSFRRSVVIVFVPNFLLDVLMIEMKRSFDEAFRSEKTPLSIGIAAQNDKHFFEPGKSSSRLSHATITINEHASQSGRKSKSSERKSYIKEKQQQLLSAYQQDRKYPSSYQPPSHPQQNKSSQKEKREVSSKPPPMPSSTHSHPEATTWGRKQTDVDTQTNSQEEKVRTYEIITTVINKVKKEHAVSISIFM